VSVEAEFDASEAAEKVEEQVADCDLELSSESELDSPPSTAPAAAVAPSPAVVIPWKSIVRVLTSDTFEPVLRTVL
jgi:hypothetical protein